MPFRLPAAGRLQLWAGRLFELLVAAGLHAACKVLPALSGSALLSFADGAGFLAYLFDGRGRAVAHQNVEAVFGPGVSRARRRQIVRASYRNALRSEALLFHLQPLTPERYARWVRIEPADLARFQAWIAQGNRGVLVSAHFGNWELLLASRTGLSFSPPVAYLAEASGSRAMDATLERLRDRGAGRGALRKRGALALRQALGQGKIVSLLVDRNVRGSVGGTYVPFLGLDARTTPLGAVLARAYGLPMGLALMVPDGPRSWRMSISTDLMPPPSDDPKADIRIALERVNTLLGDAIRREPEAWLWTIKRWKSRPTEAQGRYPAYSLHDPPP